MDKKSASVFIFFSVMLLCMLTVGLFFWGDNFISVKTENETTYKYLLSEYNGQLAYYENGNEKPVHVFDTYISALPEEDRIKLRAGIPAAGAQELMSLIEDYES